jgi:hypothetical protein
MMSLFFINSTAKLTLIYRGNLAAPADA